MTTKAEAQRIAEKLAGRTALYVMCPPKGEMNSERFDEFLAEVAALRVLDRDELSARLSSSRHLSTRVWKELYDDDLRRLAVTAAAIHLLRKVIKGEWVP